EPLPRRAVDGVEIRKYQRLDWGHRLRERSGSFAAIFVTFAAFLHSPATARELDTEARVDALRAVERVRWNHRLWPAGTTKPAQPDLNETMLRDRLDDSQRKS